MTYPVLQDKVALVTGAGMGMGAATAGLFARAGARVAVADFNEEAGRRTVAGIEADGGTACYIKVDVSRSEQVKSMVDAVIAAYGRLDTAVNNAAITPDVNPLPELDEDYWDRLMGVNLKGVALCLKYELRQLIRQGGGGSIINVSSVRGFRPRANAAAYVAAKHGVVGLTKVAAMENGARNIRINCVAPGTIDTPMLHASLARRGQSEAGIAPRLGLLNRFGTAEEVAQATLWLASDLSSYVTGTTIHVDAGYTSS
ncbi:short chain dehydrogenase [Zafaria cholistanensis]|uniref:Short chain dehydrogenase n=1 Tax=Zafaria cholistanensis TaxID=1682741 RepID=A0A5A7NQL6_9MICC|nr:glucose 1-dehydrogenase [Zafaria cholistanensis]GER22277.1 short chain dehydrogenase [Zafaria cholistanensis]